ARRSGARLGSARLLVHPLPAAVEGMPVRAEEPAPAFGHLLLVLLDGPVLDHAFRRLVIPGTRGAMDLAETAGEDELAGLLPDPLAAGGVPGRHFFVRRPGPQPRDYMLQGTILVPQRGPFGPLKARPPRLQHFEQPREGEVERPRRQA